MDDKFVPRRNFRSLLLHRAGIRIDKDLQFA
jgi:hypothetical protein